MGACIQAFVDLGFQGRLRDGDELYQAEILFLTELIEMHGTDAFAISTLCEITEVEQDDLGNVKRLAIVYKTRGTWTPLYVEFVASDVIVLFDRRRV